MIAIDYRGTLSADSPYRTDILTAEQIMMEQAQGNVTLDNGLTIPPLVTTFVDGSNPNPYGNVPVINPLQKFTQAQPASRIAPYGITPVSLSDRWDSPIADNYFVADKNPNPSDSTTPATPDQAAPANAILPGADGSNTVNTPRAQFFQMFNNTGFLFWAVVLIVGYFTFRGLLQ